MSGFNFDWQNTAPSTESQGQLSNIIWGNADISSIPDLPIGSTAAAQLSSPWLSERILPAPEPSWLTRFSKPWADFGTKLWEGGGQVIEQVGQKLPDVLWGWGKQKLGLTQRTVNEGAGTSTTYVQPAVSGGAPAQGPTIVVPSGGFIGRMPAATAKIGSVGIMIALGIGLVLLLKRK